MASLPSISAWPSLEQTARLAVLDTLFEPSPELHRLVDTAAVTRQASFASYDALVDAVERSLFALARSAATSPGDRAILLGILGSHPRLGKAAPSPKPGELSEMSALSAREQANLNLGSEEQADRLRLMNAEYEERFPGLRFVTFVNQRSRHLILEEMRRRIDRGDEQQEILDTVQAMCEIARDRAKKLLLLLDP